MNRHIFRYYFTEGIRGIFLHAGSSFAAVGVITACLLIMGSVSLVAINIQEMVTEMEQSAEIVVTVDEELSDTDARSLGTRINQIDNIMRSEWFPREQAFADWAENTDPILMEDLPLDTFPHRYRIYLIDVQFAEETAGRLGSLEGVADVRIERELLNTLLAIRRVVQLVSAVLVIALFVVSLFIMQNTIKLATFERREEIAIMRVVGATKGFIRNPFIVEGFILGLISGIISYFLQTAVYSIFSDTVSGMLEIFTPVSFEELWPLVLAFFLATGFLVGIFGSLMTIRKYLKA